MFGFEDAVKHYKINQNKTKPTKINVYFVIYLLSTLKDINFHTKYRSSLPTKASYKKKYKEVKTLQNVLELVRSMRINYKIGTLNQEYNSKNVFRQYKHPKYN